MSQGKQGIDLAIETVFVSGKWAGVVFLELHVCNPSRSP